jgi:hypothetical protein
MCKQAAAPCTHLPGTTMKGVTLPSSAVTRLLHGGLAAGAGGTVGWPHTMELYVASEPAGGGLGRHMSIKGI